MVLLAGVDLVHLRALRRLDLEEHRNVWRGVVLVELCHPSTPKHIQSMFASIQCSNSQSARKKHETLPCPVAQVRLTSAWVIWPSPQQLRWEMHLVHCNRFAASYSRLSARKDWAGEGLAFFEEKHAKCSNADKNLNLGRSFRLVRDLVPPMHAWTRVREIIVDEHIIEQRCVPPPLLPLELGLPKTENATPPVRDASEPKARISTRRHTCALKVQTCGAGIKHAPSAVHLCASLLPWRKV
jgi:hypothetical protein